MGQNNGNPPKLELELNQEARLRILKPVYEGQSSFGKFYLYTLSDIDTGETKSFFAPEEIHTILAEKHLGVGSEFLLKRVQNGKKGSSKLELSILGKAAEAQPTSSGDNLKEILLQCVIDAAEVVKQSGLQFDLDATQKLSVALLIARTR